MTPDWTHSGSRREDDTLLTIMYGKRSIRESNYLTLVCGSTSTMANVYVGQSKVLLLGHGSIWFDKKMLPVLTLSLLWYKSLA